MLVAAQLTGSFGLCRYYNLLSSHTVTVSHTPALGGGERGRRFLVWMKRKGEGETVAAVCMCVWGQWGVATVQTMAAHHAHGGLPRLPLCAMLMISGRGWPLLTPAIIFP